MYKICNFDNELICTSFDELELRLQAYRGQSVSIEYYPISKHHKRICFVEITEQGNVYNSYGPQDRFNFNTINPTHLNQ